MEELEEKGDMTGEMNNSCDGTGVGYGKNLTCREDKMAVQLN